MKHFDPNDAARNRLNTADDAILSQLCRDWLQVYRVEFVGGPKCGWVWTMDDAPDDVWSYPAGRVVHSYRLCGDRYVYCGATGI